MVLFSNSLGRASRLARYRGVAVRLSGCRPGEPSPARFPVGVLFLKVGELGGKPRSILDDIFWDWLPALSPNEACAQGGSLCEANAHSCNMNARSLNLNSTTRNLGRLSSHRHATRFKRNQTFHLKIDLPPEL